MIKLIATDLDGTLLDPKGNVPQEIFSLVRRLSARGVLFVPASGRQIDNLEKTFAPVLDACAFIAENGALLRYKNQTPYLNPLPKEKAQEAEKGQETKETEAGKGSCTCCRTGSGTCERTGNAGTPGTSGGEKASRTAA